MKSLVRHAVALECRILAMLDDRHAEHPGVLECPSQQQCRRHRMPVVGDRHTSGLFQLGDVCEQLALRAFRDGANRVDAREVGFGGLGQNEQRHVRVVVHGRRVRHARDRRKSTGDGRRDAARHRLLVFLTRLAQVHVHVDQTWAHHEASRDVHDGGPFHGQVPTDASDAPVLDEHVVHTVDPVCRIDDAPALKQPLHVPLRPPGDTGQPCARRRHWPPGRG